MEAERKTVMREKERGLKREERKYRSEVLFVKLFISSRKELINSGRYCENVLINESLVNIQVKQERSN